MPSNFKKIAQENTQLCSLMAGREKVTTDEVVNQTLTIIAFDFAPKFDSDGTPIVDETTGEADVFGVVVFQENPDKYYCVGEVFTRVCKAWASGYESPEAASKDLEEQGGVKVVFKNSKTRRGNNLVSVDILD